MAYEFLSAVLPTEGKYCVFITHGEKLRKNIFVDTLDALVATSERHNEDGITTYMGMASFDDSGYRKAENAQMVRGLFMDLDCGAGKAFPSKREAVVALHKFLTDTSLDKLGTPWLVDSGGGVHVHMPFYHAVSVADWLPLAEALKNAGARHSFPLDMTVTSDAARVLRMPGMLNFKYDPPRPVVLRQTGTPYAIEDVAQMLEPYKQKLFAPKTAIMIPGKAPAAPMTAVAKALTGNRVTWFKKIIERTKEGTGCAQIASYIQNAQQDGQEPLWRAVLSITKYCEDGDKAARKLSAMHPYDEERMLRKLSEIKGPYTCVAFNSVNPGVCEGCQHLNSKITSPISLGTELALVAEREVEQETPTGEKVKRKLPTPPRGFIYGRDGGVYYVKDADTDERKEILLVNYDLYVQSIFFEVGASTYTYSLVAEKKNETITFAINPELIGDPKGLTKALARSNIYAVGGIGHDAYLAAYVRACMTEASEQQRYVHVPEHLGWQDDGSFAAGDTVYSKRGAAYDYKFQSARLHNVIESTKEMGTLAEWRKVPEMLNAKARKDPVMWGHVVLAIGNFASALMRWGPVGAQATTAHTCSKQTGVGKSYGSRLSNSIWGQPKKLELTNTTSANTLLQRAGLLGSIVLHVDEITQQNRHSDGEYLPTFLYNFAAGTHKLKGSATGNAEITQNCVWTGIAQVSSNEPQIEAMMGARRHTSHGEAQRFVEWQIPPNWTLQWTEEEREINDLLETNHGVAGRAWVRWIMDNEETGKAMYKSVENRWRALTGASDSERFWTNYFVSTLTGVLLLSSSYANIVDFDYAPIERWCVERLEQMRAVINSNAINALDILNAYTREFSSSMIMVNGSITQALSHLAAAATPVRGAIRGRVEYDVTPGVVDYFIEITMLKRHCAHIGHSYLEFQKELAQVPGVRIRECTRNLLKGTKGPGLRTKCLQITRSTADVEADQAFGDA